MSGLTVRHATRHLPTAVHFQVPNVHSSSPMALMVFFSMTAVEC